MNNLKDRLKLRMIDAESVLKSFDDAIWTSGDFRIETHNYCLIVYVKKQDYGYRKIGDQWYDKVDFKDSLSNEDILELVEFSTSHMKERYRLKAERDALECKLREEKKESDRKAILEVI